MQHWKLEIGNWKLSPLTLCGLVMFSVLFTGCQAGHRGQEIIIEGEGTFPPEAAGVWKTDDDKWEIEFRKDGSIVSAVIPLGNIRLRPGKVKKFPTRFEGKGVFEPGLWQIYYDTQTSEMTVVLAIDHFYQDVGNHSLEGDQTDFLSGPLDLDTNQWFVDLHTQGKIEVLIWDGWTLLERKDLVTHKEPVQRGSLLFIKQP